MNVVELDDVSSRDKGGTDGGVNVREINSWKKIADELSLRDGFVVGVGKTFEPFDNLDLDFRVLSTHSFKY